MGKAMKYASNIVGGVRLVPYVPLGGKFLCLKWETKGKLLLLAGSLVFTMHYENLSITE